MIDRKALVRRHNPVLRAIDVKSPLTVGNGRFAFTADVTGFQTLYDDYRVFPLCTMSQWGWHTAPAAGNARYTLDDLEMTRYEAGDRTFLYPAERRPGNEAVYDWLRRNPHRMNLARVSLLWDGREIRREELSGIRQELDLYTGTLHSEFTLDGCRFRVRTVCAQSADVLGFSIEPASERLSVRVGFPCGSHRKHASDWRGVKHRIIDIQSTLVCAFSQGAAEQSWNFGRVERDSADGWERFWQSGGTADFSGAKDPRAGELERRAILSQYLTAAQCAGDMPPQETGLSVNSWYGKFHLEMHIIHAGWFPLWGRGGLLERSFPWYAGILGKARGNAARNGFSGARWPKMCGPEGVDSPSTIAPLLIWQQPHILYMLELARRARPDAERRSFMRGHWELVAETARFMCDFARLNARTGRYELTPPLIPAQEAHAPETVQNPVFELCYWRFGLALAIRWAEALGESFHNWRDVLESLADPPLIDGLYPAHQRCPDTFTQFTRDHPSMLYGYGFIPCGQVNRKAMSDTADKVLACWDTASLWGWDFPFCAMTLTRLGRPEAAVDVLLSGAAKNSCLTNGNNYQNDDLPLYLPGNGALLFALSMMLAGYGDTRGPVGFPRNGMWDVKVEGISPLPY